MMLRSRRGEAVTITVVALAIVAGLIGFFARPVANKLLPGTLGTDQKIVHTQTVESKPVWIKNPDGTATLCQTTSTVEDTSANPVKLTFMQKVQNLGGLGIILMVLGVVFPPFGAVLAIVWSKVQKAGKAAIAAAHAKIDEIQASRDELSEDAKLIVRSVDEGLATFDAALAGAQASLQAAQSVVDPQAKAIATASAQAVVVAVTGLKRDFLSAMSRKQNNTTKLLVAELKND